MDPHDFIYYYFCSSSLYGIESKFMEKYGTDRQNGLMMHTGSYLDTDVNKKFQALSKIGHNPKIIII